MNRNEVEIYRREPRRLKPGEWIGFVPQQTDEAIREYCRRFFLWAGAIELDRQKVIVLARPKPAEA